MGGETAGDPMAAAAVPVESGFRTRDPLNILFDPQTLSGTERLVMMLAGDPAGLSRAQGRGLQFRTALLRPISQLLRARAAGRGLAPAEGAEDHLPPGRAALGLRSIETAMELRWGPAFRQPRETLRRLLHLPPAGLMPARLAALLDATRADPPASWRTHQQWGLLADTYLMDLAFLTAQLAAAGRPQDSDALEAAQLALVEPESRRRLADLAAAGTPVLFCGFHAGAFALGRRLLRHLLPEMLLLGAHGEANQGETRVSAHDPVRAMMQMVRHLRRSGSTALIAGDGPVSGALRSVAVCGLPVQIALGAPHIVFHARCVNAFYLACWDGRRVSLELRTDTQPQQGEGLEAWTTRWMAACGAFMTDLVTGDPRNIRGHSGFWAQLDRGMGAA